MPRKKQTEPHRSNEDFQNRVSLDNNFIHFGASTSRQEESIEERISDIVPPENDGSFTSYNDGMEIINSNQDPECFIVDDTDEVVVECEIDGASQTIVNNGADNHLSALTEYTGNTIRSKKKQSGKYGNPNSKRRRSEPISDPFLQDYLDNCDFYLTILNTFWSGKSDDFTFPPYLLGSITLKCKNGLDQSNLEDSKVVYLYVSPIPEKCIIYLENSSGVLPVYQQVECSAHYAALYSIKNKRMFSPFLVESRKEADYEYTINIYIMSAAFHTPTHQSDSDQNLSMLSALEYFLKVPVPECPSSPSKPKWPHETTQELYDNVRKLRMQSLLPAEIGPLATENLLPCLRPYQQDAVQWMLSREKGAPSQNNLHPLYIEVTLFSGQKIYFNMYSGIIRLERPQAVPSPLGGILADEMGLGKTVEVLACILSHPRPSILNIPSNESVSNFSENTDILDDTDLNAQATETSDVPLLNSKSDSGSTDSLTSIETEEGITQSTVSENNSESLLSDEEMEEAKDSGTEIVSYSDTEISDYEPEEMFKRTERTVSTRSRKKAVGDDSEKEDIVLDFGDELFECLCGQDNWDWEWVQCTFCGSWQHKFCMDFGMDMDESEYLCPHCWVSDETPLAKSRATLVVTPSSIRCQWEEEIQRHLKAGVIKWTFYPGVGQLKQFMQPLRLADHDLVLVTYETLRKEIDYVDLPHSNSDAGRRLRNPKRFMAIPTPLLAVEWWRVCLDEAQMVEGVTTKTAEMALRLSAENRWCVTGTPIQKSIDDLYGLLLFLGEDPYWQKAWWKRLLYDPYRSGSAEPLLKVLSTCFWRNTKKDVLHQIGLPPQSEVTYKLVFSPVEEHFYKLQYHECSVDALRKISKFHNLDLKLKQLDKQTMAHVMGPLVRLRQACCHPQAVRGHLLPVQKSTTITMEELLSSLIKKTKLECEDFHRQFICALNGLAGIHIINEEIAEAVEKYREVLRAVKEQKDVLKTDKIQQYHTLHNLSLLLEGQVIPFEEGQSTVEVTSEGNLAREDQVDVSVVVSPCLPPNVGRTLEDETLREESKRLRSVYLEKCQSQVAAVQAQLYKAVQSVQEVMSQFYDESENWWVAGCKMFLRNDTALVFKVKDALSGKERLKDSLANRFNTLSGLMFMITKLLDNLRESHKALTEAICSLSSTPTQDDVNAAITCHLRPLVTTIEKCVYCRCHELFNHYEGLLFCFEAGFEKDPLTNEEALWGQTRKGTWADSELECALKTVLAFLRTSKVSPSVIENGNIHMKLFEAKKKEFRCLRGVWMQIRDHASALDELEMAKIRFRLRLSDEPKPDIPLPYILEPEEIQPMKLKLMSDRAVAQNDLRKKLGQLFYLQNLKKADFGRKGGSNSEPCPICQKVLGTQWSVLQCGHCFCMECIRILITEYSVGFHNRSIRCAICRQVTSHADITYVNTSPGIGTLQEEEPVKGSHSTKVEAVIRCLLTIKKSEPEAKSLVFSSWQLVLNVLEDALTENDISCVTLQSHNLQKSLWQFKHNPDVRVLLLPVHSGANGLNLIEATHVLMVEPLLNPAAEVQALGRVHRIGQTKPTTVHRFIVSSTIEERIHQACVGHTDDDSMTLAELKKLFEVK